MTYKQSNSTVTLFISHLLYIGAAITTATVMFSGSVNFLATSLTSSYASSSLLSSLPTSSLLLKYEYACYRQCKCYVTVVATYIITTIAIAIL